MKKVISGN